MSAAEPAREAQSRALGLLQLREDPQFPRIPAGQHGALVEAALEDGRLLADETRRQWGTEPAVVAAACDVPVIRSQDDAGFGSVVVYAGYASRPPAITLHLPPILRLDGLIALRGAGLFPGLGGSEPIFLAHELYHHFDCLRGGTRLARRHPVRIFGIGQWHWTSGLASLPEIAAGAFAQQLLGLSFHPKLLDFLVNNRNLADGPQGFHMEIE